MPNKIHIGKIIKQLLLIQGVSVADFAEKINCSPRNVYKILSKPNIDTALLVKVNVALGQNLFLLYLTDLEINEFMAFPLQESDKISSHNSLAVAALYLTATRKTKQ